MRGFVRSPTGEVLKISENVKDLSGRIESIDKVEK